MTNMNEKKAHDEFAANYDSQVKEYNSYGHDVIFGMFYEYLSPGLPMLDMGIGTGLSSINFAKAGLSITGLDESSKMLKECQKKNFAEELKQYDLKDLPLPFSDNRFDIVICCGVFHFMAELKPIFNDVQRVLKPAGLFGFTVASPQKNKEELPLMNSESFYKVPTSWGIPIYKHTDNYIYDLFKQIGFSKEKEQKILADSGDKDWDDILFKVFINKSTS